MAIPILHFWKKYFSNPDEGLGSTYERFIINDVLFKTVQHYKVKSVLETPSFGFTGLSGINSLGLALKDIFVNVTDSNFERLKLIEEVWSQFAVNANFDLIDDYSHLPYKDNSFDMAWNFSAIWFVDDLEQFLFELNRVSRKIILIMVPNRTGLGYLHQKYTGKNDLKDYLNEDFIKPENFIPCLKALGWKLMHDSHIDCPLWPDIGMSKEDFCEKLKISGLLNLLETKQTQEVKEPLSILDYYNGKRPSMKEEMLKYNSFEKFAPVLFKKVWAHHHYYLFLKTK